MELQPHTQLISFLDGIENPITNIISLGVEERSREYEYYYDNKMRNINAILLQYTLSGRGSFEVDGKVMDILPGQAIFVKIPSDTRYYIPKNCTENWKFIYILIETGKMGDYYDKIVEKSGMIFDIDFNSSVMTFVKDAYLRSKAGLITDFTISSIMAYEFMNRMYFHFNNSTSHHSKRVQRTLHEISTNYGHLDGIGGIAASLGISENHLIREFRHEVGTTPMKYLTQVRLEHAKKQLIATNHTIEEIAYECGYTRSNYFCKVFKQNIGVTPLTYRMG